MHVRTRLLLGLAGLTVIACGGRAGDVNTTDAGAESGNLLDGSTQFDARQDAPNLFPETGTEAATACNPQNCAQGCCAGDTCVTNITPQQCGSSGQACVQCQPDESCKGVCFKPVQNCGPSNCQGCCLGSGDCATGNMDVACGSGGQQCGRCVPSEGTGQCNPNQSGMGGTCSAQQCGPQTCPSGCCQNGKCLNGTTEAACGQLGATCQVCGTGTYCGQGMCMSGTPCTPQNCPNGCCTTGVNGPMCAPGTADTLCGTDGQQCTSCQNANQTCINGTCGVPCSPSTCHGCCDGNICAEGDQDFLCGTGGTTCTNCQPQGQTCKAGACQ